ncbi:MAG: hypothetical protein Q4B70_16035, partial [Lachnospiraceae bacterium]|nr:hypothetical protein [Lachnospiraceae bacterium]
MKKQLSKLCRQAFAFCMAVCLCASSGFVRLASAKEETEESFYQVTAKVTGKGSVKFSGQKEEDFNRYEKGAEVKFQLLAEKGYEVESIECSKEDGNKVILQKEKEIYRFNMPESDVKLKVKFSETKSDEADETTAKTSTEASAEKSTEKSTTENPKAEESNTEDSKAEGSKVDGSKAEESQTEESSSESTEPATSTVMADESGTTTDSTEGNPIQEETTQIETSKTDTTQSDTTQ